MEDHAISRSTSVADDDADQGIPGAPSPEIRRVNGDDGGEDIGDRSAGPRSIPTTAGSLTILAAAAEDSWIGGEESHRSRQQHQPFGFRGSIPSPHTLRPR